MVEDYRVYPSQSKEQSKQILKNMGYLFKEDHPDIPSNPEIIIVPSTINDSEYMQVDTVIKGYKRTL